MPLIRKDSQPAPPPLQPDLLIKLRSGTSEERWVAARGLARTPESARELGTALTSETDPRVREALLTSLVHIHTQEAVELVLPLLRSDDASVRTGALDALNAMTGAVENYIPKLLADHDPDIRLLVCDTVRRLPGPMATRLLSDLLERETAVNVCAAAVEALSEVGDTNALPVLSRCAARFPGEPFLLFSIKIAAERIGGGSRTSRPLEA